MPRSAVHRRMVPKSRLLAKQPAAKKHGAAAPSAVKGLRGFRSLSGTFSDRVDCGVSRQDAALASRATVLSDLNARLIRINQAEKQDMYYVLQCLEDPRVKAKNTKRYYAYQRWGRTGTGGTCRLQGPMERSKVESHLFKVFEAKTGVAWGSIKPGEKAKPGKYWLANPSTGSADPCALWQYYVDDGVDQKHKGWHPYDAKSAAQVEELHAEHEANKSSKNPTSKRFIDSGRFTYCMDFDTLTQRNVSTGKSRSIRRVLSNGATSYSLPSVPAHSVPEKAKTASALSVCSRPASVAGTGLMVAGSLKSFHGPDSMDTIPVESLHRPDSMATIPATSEEIEAAIQDIARNKSVHGRTSPAPKKRDLADMLLGSKDTLTTLPTASSPKRCRKDSLPAAPNSLKDIQNLVFSGEVSKLSHPELRSLLQSHGVVATGQKDDLLTRVSTLALCASED